MPGRLSALSIADGLAVLTAACAGADADQPVASFRHDLGGGGQLHAYPAEPAAERRQADRVSERAFGTRTRSPRTPYLCVWRDGPGGRRADGPPGEIFLTCLFGASAWTPPPTLVEEAAERARRQEATLRARWVRNGSAWRLVRLELEIRQPDAAAWFRSVHFDGELADVALREAEIAFPAARAEPLRFRLTGSAPQRTNRGEAARAPRVAFTISGTAQPMPDWLLY